MARTAHYNEIAEMLRNMPRGWSREYRKGRDQLADAGGPVLPNVPTPEQAMQLVGITAGGNLSGDVPYGPHKVPKDVRDAAMKGIRLSYREGYGAWAFIGLARAIELVLADGVSERTVKRMRDYLRRHAVDKGAPGFGDDRKPSRGYMAWLNWGGDPAVNWTRLFQPNPLRNPRRRRPVDSDETYLEGVERRERRKGKGERAFDTAQTAGSLAVVGAKLGGRAIPVVGEVLMVAGAGKEAVKVARRRLKGGKGSWQSDIAKIGAGALGLESFVPEAAAKKNPRRRNPRDPQTDTAAFRRWFGASKVVDERGAPLVVYHGSKMPGHDVFLPRSIKQAGTGEALSGRGVYFTSERDFAEHYAGKTGGVYSVYLKIKRPFVRGKSIWGEEAIDVALRYITAAVSARYAESKIGPLRRGQFLEDVLPPDTVTEMLLADGYDGVVDGHIYVALDPTQIKSATNNVGTFDPADPSILRNPRPTTAERTDPALWEDVKREVTAGSKGGRPGQWSARKAQLAVALYKQRGGDYWGPKSPRNALAKWTREDWRTRSGKPSLVTGERYLPARAIEALTPAEYAATTRAKRAGMRRGEQFTPQPERIAAKTSRYRKNPGRC